MLTMQVAVGFAGTAAARAAPRSDGDARGVQPLVVRPALLEQRLELLGQRLVGGRYGRSRGARRPRRTSTSPTRRRCRAGRRASDSMRSANGTPSARTARCSIGPGACSTSRASITGGASPRCGQRLGRSRPAAAGPVSARVGSGRTCASEVQHLPRVADQEGVGQRVQPAAVDRRAAGGAPCASGSRSCSPSGSGPGSAVDDRPPVASCDGDHLVAPGVVERRSSRR